MSLTLILRSLIDQAGTWFVGLVLALLGVFSGRIVETVKFALNRADLRAKYFEKMAVDLSHFVFVIDRLNKVYYRAKWADDDMKSGIAEEYNTVMNRLCRREYVYRGWLRRYWGAAKAEVFTITMQKVRAVDTALIRLNENVNSDESLANLDMAFIELEKSARALLSD